MPATQVDAHQRDRRVSRPDVEPWVTGHHHLVPPFVPCAELLGGDEQGPHVSRVLRARVLSKNVLRGFYHQLCGRCRGQRPYAHHDVLSLVRVQRDFERSGGPHVFLEREVPYAIFEVLEATPPIRRPHEHAAVTEVQRRQVRRRLHFDLTRAQCHGLHHAAVLVHQLFDGAERHQRSHGELRALFPRPGVRKHHRVSSASEGNRAFECAFAEPTYPTRQRVHREALDQAIT